MATIREDKPLKDLSPEQQAKARAIGARWHSPDARASEAAAREALDEEYRRTGTIEAESGRVEAADLLRFRELILRLQGLRQKAGITLAMVEERSGIDQPALSRLENGHTPNPTLATILRYARAVGAEIRWDVVEATHDPS